MGTGHGPPYHSVEWDDALERQPGNRRLIQRGLTRVGVWVEEHASTRRLTLASLIDFHRVTFEAVFPDFAGKLRGVAPAYLPVNVTFGSFRGVRYDDVPDELERLFQHAGRLIEQLDALGARTVGEAFDEQTLRVASYVHCEIVRIHPFINGNGRMARLCLNYFARRYGMRSVSFERPTGDYMEANRTWIEQRAIDPFVSFLRPRWKGRR